MTPPTQSNASVLSITLFGPLEVLLDGQPLPPVRSRKILWLLALLTLRHGRPVEREWLAGTLWPDADQTQAFANLRPALSQLRTALGSHASRLDAPSRHTLQLNLSGAEVDVVAFDAAIASRQPDAMERAVAVYRGPLLEGCNEDWVFQERSAREQAFGEALQRLAEFALHRGDAMGAATYLRQSVGIDPLGDTAHRSLMEALAKGGDRNAALDLYREFSERLRRELGATPHEQTRALYHRLRTEARDGSQTGQRPNVTTPGASSPPAVTGHLPHPLTELVGREDERLEVAALLHRSRLVTLTGQGGIGKTRLSVTVAHAVSGEYPDGVWLVPLEWLPPQGSRGGSESASGENESLIQQIAAVLGIKEGMGRPLLPLVTEHLRSKRLLLVLDNCEHVLAASARLSAHLLRECLGLRILATSREALKVSGETVWAVPALTVPNPDHLPSGKANLARIIVGYDGVRLFAERAQAACRTFAVTGDNARDIALLCWHLQGVPLALELAAARAALLTPAQILAQFDARPLDALAAPQRDIAPRHRTLRATLEWSYDLLSPEAQAFFADMGVFRGGWTLEAAQAISPNTDVVEMLNVLREASLINAALSTYEAGSSGGGSRFSMLETVRGFAAEVLGRSERVPAICHRHGAYYAEGVKKWATIKAGGQAHLFAFVEREYANITAALAWLAEPDEAIFVELCCALASYWEITCRAVEGRRWLEKAARQFAWKETEASTGCCATMVSPRHQLFINTQVSLAIATGDWEAAAELGIRSSDYYFRGGNSLEGRTKLYNASTYVFQFDLKRTLSILERCLPMERAASDGNRANPFILSQMALVTYLVGQSEKSAAFVDETLSLCRDLEKSDPYGVAVALLKIGRIAMAQGHLADAQERFETAALIGRHLPTEVLILTGAFCGLAALAREAGDANTEEAFLTEAIAAAGPEPRIKVKELLQKERTEYLLVRGDTEGAAAHLRESLVPIHGKAKSHRWFIYPLLLLSADIEQVSNPSRLVKAVHLLGAAGAAAHRLGLAAPERAEIQRATRLRATLSERLGTEPFIAEERIGSAMDDEAAIQLALTLV